MDEYAIVFARSARKEIESLAASIQARTLARIEALGNEPRPRGCRKLVGSADLWRLRVGEYRVAYSIDDIRRVVDIIPVRHRKDASQ